MQLIDIALISYEDDILMYKNHSIEECLKRWRDTSASEVVRVKNGEHGCNLLQKGVSHHIPPDVVVSPIDTTAAGDSFNGAYLASRLADEDPIRPFLQAKNVQQTSFCIKVQLLIGLSY